MFLPYGFADKYFRATAKNGDESTVWPCERIILAPCVEKAPVHDQSAYPSDSAWSNHAGFYPLFSCAWSLETSFTEYVGTEIENYMAFHSNEIKPQIEWYAKNNIGELPSSEHAFNTRRETSELKTDCRINSLFFSPDMQESKNLQVYELNY